MDSVEHNGCPGNVKHFSQTSKKLEKGSYVGDTATPRSVLGFHLLGDNQRQAGPHTRSHFRTVRNDRNRSIGRDGNEDARVDHCAVRHLSGTGL